MNNHRIDFHLLAAIATKPGWGMLMELNVGHHSRTALMPLPHSFAGYTRPAMRRSAILLVMLFAMLWQSMALARAGSTVNPLADRGHAALHLQGVGHHHDEDGSYHLDDSQESVQHVLFDHVGAGAAILASPLHDFLPLGSSIAHGFQGTPAPNPFLDGLLRPPRLHA